MARSRSQAGHKSPPPPGSKSRAPVMTTPSLRISGGLRVSISLGGLAEGVGGLVVAGAFFFELADEVVE